MNFVIFCRAFHKTKEWENEINYDDTDYVSTGHGHECNNLYIFFSHCLKNHGTPVYGTHDTVAAR